MLQAFSPNMAPSCSKTFCDHSSLIKITKRPSPLLLKDYLRDDLSSCSSSGFKSLPRRQCCTTVGFSRDPQLQRKRRNTLPRRQSTSSSSSTTMSLALQRASEVVINAIKSLPLKQKSENKVKKGGVALSRSFSRKLLSRSFWRKVAAKEDRSGGATRRCSFRELLLEERDFHKTTSLNEETTTFTAPSIITTTSSGCGSNSDSWGESEFTFSDSSTENDAKEEEDAPRHKIEGIKTMDWPCEKEQFSPVSVLDFQQFEDEQVMKPHLNSTGAKHKHMQKRRHFRSVSSLKPVALVKRIARSELEDIALHNNNHSANKCSNNVEDNARDLVSFMKTSIPYNCLIFEAENLLFDYFKQSIGESDNNNNDIDHSKKLQLCEVAEDWIRGQPKEVYLGWEVKEGRGVYIREMDKYEDWKNYSHGETQQLVMELENEVFASLVNEVVLDLAA